MSLLPEKELLSVEKWFTDLKEALGLSAGADRGRVLASVKKLVTDNASYEQEKQVVAAAYGFKRWGDCYACANAKLQAVPEVDLPKVFDQPPNGWVFKPGGDYDKAQKRLVKTRLRVKELWAYLDNEMATDQYDQEWADSIKAQAIEVFKASKDAGEFEQLCLAFIRNYEEEDPATAWVEVAGEAASALDRDSDLPITAVDELIEYARNNRVEATGRNIKFIRERPNPASDWFEYLLTAYLTNKTRPDIDSVFETSQLFKQATEYWGCFEEYSSDIYSQKSRKRSYDPRVSLGQIVAAIKKLNEFLQRADPAETRDDVAKAIKQAVDGAEDCGTLPNNDDEKVAGVSFNLLH